jgi:hypothetical protein
MGRDDASARRARQSVVPVEDAPVSLLWHQSGVGSTAPRIIVTSLEFCCFALLGINRKVERRTIHDLRRLLFDTCKMPITTSLSMLTQARAKQINQLPSVTAPR